MKKTIVLFLIFLLITFIFIINIHDIRSFAKKRLSERTKEIVKEVIFGKDRMKQIKDLQKYRNIVICIFVFLLAIYLVIGFLCGFGFQCLQ